MSQGSGSLSHGTAAHFTSAAVYIIRSMAAAGGACYHMLNSLLPRPFNASRGAATLMIFSRLACRSMGVCPAMHECAVNMPACYE